MTTPSAKRGPHSPNFKPEWESVFFIYPCGWLFYLGIIFFHKVVMTRRSAIVYFSLVTRLLRRPNRTLRAAAVLFFLSLSQSTVVFMVSTALYVLCSFGSLLFSGFRRAAPTNAKFQNCQRRTRQYP